MKRFSAILLIALFIGLTALLIPVHRRMRPYAYDDAYIHFRIAQNLADHSVPYFNVDEPVNGSSSTAWVILLATFWFLLRIVQLDQHFLGSISVLNALSTVLGAILYASIFARLCRQKSSVWLAQAVIFLVYVAILLSSSIGLMETPFTLLVAGLAILLLLKQRPVAFILFGLLPFFRPELAVMSLLAAVYAYAVRVFTGKQILLYSCSAIVPLFVYQLYFFHSVIPHSMIAKSSVYVLSSRQIFAQLSRLTAPGFPNVEERLDHTILLFILGFAGVMLSSFYRRKEQERWKMAAIVLLSGFVVFGSYLIAGTILFDWYYPLIGIPLLLSLGLLVMFFRSRVLRIVFALVCIPFVYSQLAVLRQTVQSAWSNPAEAGLFLHGARVRQYQRIGRLLYEQYPEATLMTSEIGGLGHEFRGKILDAAGLITPAALRFHPMQVPEERKSGAIGAIPVGFIQEANPALIVSYDIFIESFLKSNIKSRYREFSYPVFLEEDSRKLKRKPLWGIRSMHVFIRTDLKPFLPESMKDPAPVASSFPGSKGVKN